MKVLQWAAGLTALLAPMRVMAIPGFTDEQLAALAAGQSPDRTQVYLRQMHNDLQASNGPSRAGWTTIADSHQAGYSGLNAIDSNFSTFWETELTPTTTQFPHSITIDMKQNYWVQGVTYLPRQDGILNGTIGQHAIQLSTDGVNWGSSVAFGLFHDDSTLKVANFSTTQARYIRVQSTSESGNRGPWTTAADINIYSVPSYTPPNPGVVGAYGPTINFPTVLVHMTVLHTTGAVMGWSSYLWDQFTPVRADGTTWTTFWNPQTEQVSDAIIQSVRHDMFCPGLSRDSAGRAIVTGGSNANATSAWDDVSQSWVALPFLNIPRGYQGQTTMSNGNLFTIGGSFSGGQFYKPGEVFDFAANRWVLRPGCLVQPMLTNDAQGIYRADNHAWLIAQGNGMVLQAGPSKAMNWYNTTGNGSVTPAGTRGNDNDAMNGNAVLYDAVLGYVLAVGGSPDYNDSPATANAHVLTIGAPGQPVQVQQIQSMHYPRAFANSVILPSGQVFIVGGQSYADPFTDTTPVMTPELFDPITRTFSLLAPIAAIRNYHSTALLLPDASVLIGGGGLCGNCSTNKFDAQIYYPPYFYNSAGTGPSTRPVINTISGSTFAPGAKIIMTVSMPVTRFAMLRYGSSTHALDTDQRRVPLNATLISGTTYSVTLPTSTGILIPGAWMMFAVADGVPSVSRTLMITN